MAELCYPTRQRHVSGRASRYQLCGAMAASGRASSISVSWRPGRINGSLCSNLERRKRWLSVYDVIKYRRTLS